MAKNKNNNESKKNFFLMVGTVFGIVGILHLYRAVSEWSLTIQNFTVPVWFSFVAGIFILVLSHWAFKLSKQ